MATLTVQGLPTAGGVLTRITPAGGGDEMPNSGQEKLLLLNAGAAKTVTLAANGTDPDGATWTDLVVSLADGTVTPVLHEVQNLAPGRFNNVNRRVNITYSAVTGLTLFLVSH